MKKCAPEYMSALSRNDLDTIEEIIDYKYRKFLIMYRLLKEFSSNISSIQYNKTSLNILEVDVKFAGIDIKHVLKKVEKRVDKLKYPEMVQLDSGKKNLIIRIDKVETDF